MNKEKIIITGASGFIGTNLVNKLLETNINNILALDIKESEHLPKEVEQVVGDFSDHNLLDTIINPGDTIIHLACPTVPATSEKYIDIDINTNILGSVKMMNTAAQKKCAKFIFFSSGGTVYGDQGESPISENTTPRPQNLHGTMKLTIENYLRTFNSLHDLNYLIIRPSNPYGWKIKRSKNQGIIDVFINKIKNNEELTIWGDGNIIRDYIHINDLVECVYGLIEKNINNETINIGTGIGTSINELINIIQDTAKKKLKINYENDRGFDLKYNVLNIEKAKKLINWQPKISLEDGIAKLYK
jgi:UDP-glucose 4-epimerase